MEFTEIPSNLWLRLIFKILLPVIILTYGNGREKKSRDISQQLVFFTSGRTNLLSLSHSCNYSLQINLLELRKLGGSPQEN